MVSVLVGPFDCKDAADAHIEFCEERGDGATMRAITKEEADREYGDLEVISSEDDREYAPPEDHEFDPPEC